MQLLPPPALARFEKLRSQCLELRQIAADIAHSRTAEIGAPLESLQLAGLDRLLWIFLRLLFTRILASQVSRSAPTRGYQAGNRRAISGCKKHRRRRRLAAHAKNAPHTRRLASDVKDRLANYEKAKANHELVQLEIDRLENKIKSLAELSVNRQEPDFISGQVDQVAGSMLETEKR